MTGPTVTREDVVGVRTRDKDLVQFLDERVAEVARDISLGLMIATARQIVWLGHAAPGIDREEDTGVSFTPTSEWGRIGSHRDPKAGMPPITSLAHESLSAEDRLARFQKLHIPLIGQKWPIHKQVGIVVAVDVQNRYISIVEGDTRHEIMLESPPD